MLLLVNFIHKLLIFSQLKNLYTVIETQMLTDLIAVTKLQLDAEHPIFEGHFPQQPVMPGVCQIQLLTDIAGSVVGRKLTLRKASNIKFLALLDPRQCDVLTLHIEIKEQSEAGVNIVGKLSSENHIYLKFRGDFH